MFRQDVSGLVQKAAGDVAILCRPAPGVRLAALTGYEGVPPAGPIQVRQKDMGTGDSQVLLARLNVGPGRSGQRALGTVELRYTDLFSQRAETLSLPVYADASRLASYDPLWDVEVLRNVTIQRTAEGLKEIDRLYKAQRYQEAYDLASRSEQELRRVAALTGEAQMLKDADLMRTYQATLSKWIETRRATPGAGGSRAGQADALLSRPRNADGAGGGSEVRLCQAEREEPGVPVGEARLARVIGSETSPEFGLFDLSYRFRMGVSPPPPPADDPSAATRRAAAGRRARSRAGGPPPHGRAPGPATG